MDLKYTPCPSNKFRRESNTVKDVQPWANDYFHHLTSLYPRKIRNDVRMMFDKNKNVWCEEGMLAETNGMYASTQRDWNGKTFCTVVIDKSVYENPLLNCWMKIHEIGVHVGQILADDRHKAFDNLETDFTVHSEMTAAVCEYHFVHPLSRDFIAESIKNIRNPVLPNGDIMNLQKGVQMDTDFILAQDDMFDYVDYRNDQYYHFAKDEVAVFKENYAALQTKRDTMKSSRSFSFFTNAFSKHLIDKKP